MAEEQQALARAQEVQDAAVATQRAHAERTATEEAAEAAARRTLAVEHAAGENARKAAQAAMAAARAAERRAEREEELAEAVERRLSAEEAAAHARQDREEARLRERSAVRERRAAEAALRNARAARIVRAWNRHRVAAGASALAVVAFLAGTLMPARMDQPAANATGVPTLRLDYELRTPIAPTRR